MEGTSDRPSRASSRGRGKSGLGGSRRPRLAHEGALTRALAREATGVSEVRSHRRRGETTPTPQDAPPAPPRICAPMTIRRSGPRRRETPGPLVTRWEPQSSSLASARRKPRQLSRNDARYGYSLRLVGWQTSVERISSGRPYSSQGGLERRGSARRKLALRLTRGSCRETAKRCADITSCRSDRRGVRFASASLRSRSRWKALWVFRPLSLYGVSEAGILTRR
jgi:hypothetical protein